MPTTYITRQEAAELSGLTLAAVKNAVDKRIVPGRTVGTQSLIDVDDVVMLAMLNVIAELPVGQKRRIRDWLRGSPRTPQLALSEVLVVMRSERAEQAGLEAERYAALRDEWIISDPDVRGGEPVIKGSRVGVHVLAERVVQGESEEVLADDFPHIPREARDVAVRYARTHPRVGRPRRRGQPA